MLPKQALYQPELRPEYRPEHMEVHAALQGERRPYSAAPRLAEASPSGAVS